MIKLWTDEAWADYLYWQGEDRKTLKRINLLIKDIERDPFDGIGKAEPLKHILSGYWSRRIDDTNRSTRSRTVSFILFPAVITTNNENLRFIASGDYLFVLSSKRIVKPILAFPFLSVLSAKETTALYVFPVFSDLKPLTLTSPCDSRFFIMGSVSFLPLDVKK